MVESVYLRKLYKLVSAKTGMISICLLQAHSDTAQVLLSCSKLKVGSNPVFKK